MKIAVVSIALNEEKFISRWYESAKDADYVILGDTGSTDTTVNTAKSHGIIVHHLSIKPWRFDDARNALHALIPSDVDFVVNLDVDEVLVPGWRQELEKIRPETTRPRYQYTWSWKEDGTPGLQYGGDKIHARHGYRWKHPVHEVITADRITEVQEWTKLEIHHYPDHSKSRGQYFPLLELAVAEQPWDDRNSYYLGREYCYHRMWDKAAPELKRYLELPTAKWPAERAAAMRWLAKAEPNNAYDWLKKAMAEDPGRREAIIDYAMFEYNRQGWQNCYWAALDAIKITEKPLDYLCEEFAWGETAYDLAAISAWNMGFKEEALKYGELAVEAAPDNERLQRNLDWYKRIL